ncbi:Hint domain-containing protein [Hyphomicrobium sp. 2TAF46]|uniref:Hint domain-containing protein n=1 Tax=Hyphomicrobium sp. 2TAF46 TaxID=3233019 RepID=UPI003F909F62
MGGDGPGSGGGGSNWGGGGGVACFLAGTKILTADFERTVEDLRAGDTLPTISGGTRTIKKIRSWTAERRADEKWSDDVAPIKVCRGALGPNVPQRDLYLSPNHALYVDGVLISVGNLVNGRSIVRCSDYDGDLITYFHIELEDHQVIWANGAPVESRLAETMTPFAPLWSGGRRFELSSRLRSAISPWYDTRTQFDKIRDRIEEQSEPSFAIA